MSEDNDKITCYFRSGKGYTGHEDYPCPIIGQCDCDDCFIIESAVRNAIKAVSGQIDDLDETQTPGPTVLFELSCEEEDGETDNEHSEA